VVMIATLPAAAGAQGRAGDYGPRIKATNPADVKPPEPGTFATTAVQQTFTKTAGGGVHRVVTLESSDATQIGLVRVTLRKIADDFASYYAVDSAHPSRSGEIPGLHALVAAAPGSVKREYIEVRGGAEIRYSSDDRELVDALHQWFDAQRDGVAGDAPAKTPSIMAAH
jgi:hypothetical protein